ncbi:MAG: family 43 glycosylhydrolase [Microthrixaceae bacterium]|nr:family 43 glycosylhydrolase [Microthrixaceae bacterium]
MVVLFLGLLTVAAGTYFVVSSKSDKAQTDPHSTTTTSPPALVWQNPVIDADFPDPAIIRVDDRYVAFATNGPKGQIQVASSEDLAIWKVTGDALGSLPEWASDEPDLVWAPSVGRIGDNWLMFATFRHAASGRQCIGLLHSGAVEGPYIPASAEPFLCPVSQGGAIDPELFIDGEIPWLLWKVDGNCCGKPSLIRSQRLAEDGRSLIGEPVTILELDQDWERNPATQQSTIEGPAMARIDGRLVLLYSANGYAGPRYAVGQAICVEVSGPCSKTGAAPVLSTSWPTVGPGGAMLFKDSYNRDWIAYHAWTGDSVGYDAGGARAMHIAPVVLIGDRLIVLGPTTDPMSLEHDARVPTASGRP